MANHKPNCPKGHPYSGDNLYITPRGLRYCRICRREQRKRERERPDFLEKIWKPRFQRMLDRNPDYLKHRNWRVKYGLSPEDVRALMEQQGNACAICRREFDSSRVATRPVVDHDHKSGAARALLCSRCNILVGSLESPFAEAAKSYLSRYQNADPQLPQPGDVALTAEGDAEAGTARPSRL